MGEIKMKIDLTKEEWEFLKNQIKDDLQHHYDIEESEYPNCVVYFDKYESLCLSILEKLGSEWVDDEN